MTIRIVTDSTCDLPLQLLTQHEIAVIPMYINIGDQSYQDRVDLTREQFYANLARYSPPPQTAAPAPGAFAQVYDRLAAEGASEILSIHIAAGVSAVLESARLGAEMAKQAKVTLVDSLQFSLGLGFTVLKAVELVAAGLGMREIVARLEDQARRTYMFAVVDTFEFLRRSGRVTIAQSTIGSLLGIKPLLSMHNGVAKADRVRTRRKALERVIEMTTKLAPLEQLGFIYTDSPTAAQELKQRVQHLIPSGILPHIVGVTPVVGAHVGLGGLGIVCVASRHQG